jgi:DNA-directed RNA polymerase I, II, and III subunit RPABC5
MIIPVRCFTCNKVIGHLYEEYQNRVQRAYQEMNEEERTTSLKFNMSTKKMVEDKTVEGKILDEIGCNKYCCRMIMLSTVDLTTKL